MLRRGLLLTGGLAVLGLLWIVVTGLLVRSQVSAVEDRLASVQREVAAGNVAAARNLAADVPGLTRRARLLTSGPAWWTAAHIPYFGRPVAVLRSATVAGAEVGTEGVTELIRVADSLDPAKLRVSGDAVDLAPLADSAPRLERAATVLREALDRVSRAPSRTWFHPVDNARYRLVAQLQGVTGYVDAARNAAEVLPSMLGADRPQRYFIGLQNEAEMRGTGGLPGAFAIAVADKGRITFTHFESDAVLLPRATRQFIRTGLEFGKGFDGAYGRSGPTDFIVNSNLSPHFPYAARIWATMWEKISGEHVDGAVAVDPTALAYFLLVTGPVTIPDGTTVSASNIVALTQRDNYALFNDNLQRKDFLVQILKSASKVLTSGRGDAAQLARTISQVARQQRLLVWTSDRAAEAVLARTDYGGVIPADDRPLSALVLNNIAAGKLDFYLKRSIDYQRVGCGPMRDVFVTVTLTNTAPPAGLPPYVVDRLDKRAYPTRPGDNRTLLDYYATAGAQLLSVTLDGKQSTAAVETDRGHPIFRMDVELPRDTTRTITLHLEEPAGSGSPIVWRQPGVTPIAVTERNQPCG